MAIDQEFPPYTGDTPDRAMEESVFDTSIKYIMDYFVQFIPIINTWRDQANTLGVEINDNALLASSSAVTATSVANNKGAWADRTGALNIPASVNHTGSTWSLNVNLADVTLSEPAEGNTDYTEISGVTQQELDLKADQTEMDKRLNFIPTSKVVAGQIALSIIATHNEATTTTTADYIVDNIVQADGTGDFYTCILNSTAEELLTNTTYFTYSNANLQGTDLNIAFSKGFGDNGAINTNEVFTGATDILPSLVPGKNNYVYRIKDTSWGATKDKPLYGDVSNVVRTEAGYNPDATYEGKVYPTSNGVEKVANGDFSDGLTGWTDESTFIGSIAVVNGKLQLTSLDGLNRAIATATFQTEFGVLYTNIMEQFSNLDNDYRIGSTPFGADYISETGNTAGEFTNNFTAQGTTAYITIYGTTTDDITYFDNISIFETNLELDEAYTTERTYMDGYLEVDVSGNVVEWVAGDVVPDLSIVSIQTEKLVAEVVEAKTELLAPNVCTAWVNFDGTTTPPTIRDSFNIVDVVRLATGTFVVYFKVAMDNKNYSHSTTVGQGSSTINYAFGATKTNVHLDRIQLHCDTSNGVDSNRDNMMVQIFGGKN